MMISTATSSPVVSVLHMSTLNILILQNIEPVLEFPLPGAVALSHGASMREYVVTAIPCPNDAEESVAFVSCVAGPKISLRIQTSVSFTTQLNIHLN